MGQLVKWECGVDGELRPHTSLSFSDLLAELR